MSKKDFIALADAIREHNNKAYTWAMAGDIGMPFFHKRNLDTLADFCASQNPRFNRERWLAYIAGECGPSGGAVK